MIILILIIIIIIIIQIIYKILKIKVNILVKINNFKKMNLHLTIIKLLKILQIILKYNKNKSKNKNKIRIKVI